MSAPPRKALFLHGFRQSGETMRKMCGELAKALPALPSPARTTTGAARQQNDAQQQPWSCTFLDATHRASKPAGRWSIEYMPSLADGSFEWWNVPDDEPAAAEDGSRPYDGIEATLARVTDVIRREGPFEILCGYSQGAMLATILTALSENPSAAPPEWCVPAHKRWRAVVLVCGGVPRPRGFLQRFKLPLVTPSVHLLSEKDTALYEAGCRLYSDWYHEGTRRLVKHDEGHMVPSGRTAVSGASRHLAERLNRTVWCFDFDGVLCDSAAECAHTGWRGAQALGLIDPALGPLPPAKVVAAFCQARPVLETGFEAIVIVYMLVVDAWPAERVLQTWSTEVRDSCMAERMKQSEETLKGTHHRAREQWIAADEDGWLASHGEFAPAVEFARRLVARGEVVYVITTKAAVFAHRLLASMNLAVPEDRVFGLGSGPKRIVLETIATEHEAVRGSFWFIEDRLNTLRDVQHGRMPMRLVLAGWGYNTREERAAAADEGFSVLEFDDLATEEHGGGTRILKSAV